MVTAGLLHTNRSPLHFATGSDGIMSLHHRDDSLMTQIRLGIIKSWNIVKCGYKLDRTIETNHKGFCRFECASDQNLLFTPYEDNDIAIYDLNTLQLQNVLRSCANQQNIEIATRNDPNYEALNIESKATSPSINHVPLGALMCMKYVKFSDQSYVLAGYESGVFLTWDLRMNTVINSVNFQECPMAFDFCSETNRGIYGNATDKLGIFGYTKSEMKLMYRGDIPIKNAGTNCIRIRKDQKIFCSGGWDGRIRVFSWKSLRPLTVLTDHKGPISDINYSNGKVDMWKSPIMATAASDGQISLWNLYN